MAAARTVRVFVKGNHDLLDVTMAQPDGGSELDQGLAARVGSRFEDTELLVARAPSSGFSSLRDELESGSSELLAFEPDVVILSVADDVHRIQESGAQRTVDEIQSALVACIGVFKQAGAHVLIANTSTLAPGVKVHDFSSSSGEPFSLAAHRMAYMLVRLSHEHGVSIVDVDTLLAGLGGNAHVLGPATYSAEAAGVIADEILRILEDYGFFDERSLVAQVGAQSQ